MGWLASSFMPKPKKLDEDLTTPDVSMEMTPHDFSTNTVDDWRIASSFFPEFYGTTLKDADSRNMPEN